MASFLLPSFVWADGFSAIAEFDYSSTTVRTEDSGRLLTETKSDTFLHRYFLNLDKTLYPNLKFVAGGTFEQDISNNETDNATLKTTATTKYGHLGLLLATQFLSAGIGYNRNESDVSVSGQPSEVPNVRENYSASLGLRPEGLPTVNANFVRTYTFDKERISEDRINDFLSVGLKYEPYRNLQLQSQASLNDQTDKLQDLNVRTLNYSLRATYARQFGERVSAFATYTFSGRETKTAAGGTGDVLFQVFPFSGLSAISVAPTPVTLDPNPALVDGDLVASAGIDLGPTPIGDDKYRNIGVDFIVASEVNTIFLWVDRQLPPSVAMLFSWDIYVSNDNLNWTLNQSGLHGVFGEFDNRFEIKISKGSARFLKVVTRPPHKLPPTPGRDLSHIFVTEMQTFLSRPAEEVGGTTTTQTSHVYDLNVRWRILDRPNLFYDFYYWSLITQPGDVRSILTNSLNLSHRFNAVFSGSARIGREDGWEPTNKTSANVYSASVTALPLPTLFHSLVVSGRFEQSGAGSSNTNSAFLTNSAELYRGLSVNLSGGVSVANSVDSRRTVSTVINSGVTAIPHPALSVNLNFSQTKSNQTGGGGEDFATRNSSTFTRTGNLSFGYTPFPTLYIFTSFGINAQTDRETTTLQNYAVTWSPFRDGDLQFNFLYSESITSDNVKERTITPGLRWYLRRNTTLDVAYVITNSSVLTQKTDTRTFSANLRVGLF